MPIVIPGFAPSSAFTDTFLQYVRIEQEARRQRDLEKANKPGKGQAIGQIAGTIGGFLIGGPSGAAMAGAAIGGAVGGGVGGLIDPTVPGQGLQQGANALSGVTSAFMNARDVTDLNRADAQGQFGPGTSLDELIGGAEAFKAGGGGDFTAEFARQLIGSGDDPRIRRRESRRTRQRREEEDFRQQGRFELEDFRSSNRSEEALLRSQQAGGRQRRSELTGLLKPLGFTVDEGIAFFQQARAEDPSLTFSGFIGAARLSKRDRDAAAKLDATLVRDQALSQQDSIQKQEADLDKRSQAIREDPNGFVINPKQIKQHEGLLDGRDKIIATREELGPSFPQAMEDQQRKIRSFVSGILPRKPPPTLLDILQQNMTKDGAFYVRADKNGQPELVPLPVLDEQGKVQTRDIFRTDGSLAGTEYKTGNGQWELIPEAQSKEDEVRQKRITQAAKELRAGGEFSAARIIDAVRAEEEAERELRALAQGRTTTQAPDPVSLIEDPKVAADTAKLIEQQALPSSWPSGTLLKARPAIEAQVEQILQLRVESGGYPDEATKDKARYLGRLLREIENRQRTDTP